MRGNRTRAARASHDPRGSPTKNYDAVGWWLWGSGLW